MYYLYQGEPGTTINADADEFDTIQEAEAAIIPGNCGLISLFKFEACDPFDLSKILRVNNGDGWDAVTGESFYDLWK